MRVWQLLTMTLVLAPLAGCLGNDAAPQEVDGPAAWLVAQADSAGGDVAAFVYEIPADLACVPEQGAKASAEADADGVSASAAAGCLDASASASAEGASASAGGASAQAGMDGLSIEVVPDTSALGDVQDVLFLVLTVKDGTATHVHTVLSTTIERVQTDATGAVETSLEAAQAVPFTVDLSGIGVAAGDRIAFVMAASGQAAAQADGIVSQAQAGATSAISGAGLPEAAVDFGFAFRIVPTAQADAQAALQELQSLAGQSADGVAGAAGEMAGQAAAAADGARSLLDGVIASGKADVLAAVGQAQGVDVGVFAEFTNGALQGGAHAVMLLTESMPVEYAMEGLLKPLIATEELTISYQGGLGAAGWGFGVGGYGGAENGRVDYDVQANVHDQSFAQSGSITAAGPFSVGDVDPAYILEGAGGEAQSLAFTVARKAQDEATSLFAVHADLAASLTALLGVSEVSAVAMGTVQSQLPVQATPHGLRIGTPAIGAIEVVGFT